MSDPSVNPLLEVCLLSRVELTSASGHNVRVTRDGVGHVEVVDGVSEQSSAHLSVTTVSEADSVKADRLDHVVSDEMRGELGQASSDLIKRVIGQGSAKLLGKSSKHHPVVTSEAWRSDSGTALLDTAIHVDIGGILLKVTGGGQD